MRETLASVWALVSFLYPPSVVFVLVCFLFFAFLFLF